MNDTQATLLDDVMKELDELPADDPKRVMLNAFREIGDGKLTGWTIEGEGDDEEPRIFLQVVTVGFLGETFPPKYFVRPGSGDREDQKTIAMMIAALYKEPHRKTPLDALRFLIGNPVTTLVHATYGLKERTGEIVVELWHHPEIKLAQAVHLVFIGIDSEAANRAKSG